MIQLGLFIIVPPRVDNSKRPLRTNSALTVSDSECDEIVPTNYEPCKTNVIWWFLNAGWASQVAKW